VWLSESDSVRLGKDDLESQEQRGQSWVAASFKTTDERTGEEKLFKG